MTTIDWFRKLIALDGDAFEEFIPEGFKRGVKRRKGKQTKKFRDRDIEDVDVVKKKVRKGRSTEVLSHTMLAKKKSSNRAKRSKRKIEITDFDYLKLPSFISPYFSLSDIECKNGKFYLSEAGVTGATLMNITIRTKGVFNKQIISILMTSLIFLLLTSVAVMFNSAFCYIAYIVSAPLFLARQIYKGRSYTQTLIDLTFQQSNKEEVTITFREDKNSLVTLLSFLNRLSLIIHNNGVREDFKRDLREVLEEGSKTLFIPPRF